MNENKPIIILLAIIGLLFAAWLAFGFFGIQAAFIDNEVDEANPLDNITTTLPSTTEAPTTSPPSTHPSTVAPTTMPPSSEASVPETSPTTAAPTTQAPTTVPPTTAPPTKYPVGELNRGVFGGINDYDVAGDALIISDGETRFLRFENFDSDNGPDLNVYLRNDAGDILDLGDLKGNIGDQNYELSDDIDLSEYNEVLIWCVRFNAAFGFASLA